MKLTFDPENRDIANVILLGLLWGLIEGYLGKVIKGWQPNFFGFVMPFLIACYIIFAKRKVAFDGSIMLMGVIAALLKLFVSGMVLHGAFMAILMEAALAEVTFILFGLTFLSSTLVGIFLQLYSLFHPVISRGTLCQSTHFVRFNQWLTNQILGGLSLSNQMILAVLIFLHALVGLLAAVLLWPLIKNTK